MKTSYILLAVITLITLTGMVATDVLLTQQYREVDWQNPYQEFTRRALPKAKHWVIKGSPRDEIVFLQSKRESDALIDPAQLKFFRVRQQADTAFLSFTPDNLDEQNEPRAVADYELRHQLVLRAPSLETLRIEEGRVSLKNTVVDNLTVSLKKSRLLTSHLAVLKTFNLTGSQNSFVMLGPTDQYKALQVVMQDSSGIQLNDTQADTFASNLSPRAEIQLKGRALKWLK